MHAHIADVKADTNFISSDIIFISETWAQSLDSDSVYALDNFSTFRTDIVGNGEKRHQGILFYVHDRIQGFEIDNKPSLPGFQMMHVSFSLPDSSRFSIVGIYKAPQCSVHDFLTHLDDELLRCQDESIMVVGDFNIDLLESNGASDRLQSLFRTKSYSQCVSVHSTNYGSLLDHV